VSPFVVFLIAEGVVVGVLCGAVVVALGADLFVRILRRKVNR